MSVRWADEPSPGQVNCRQAASSRVWALAELAAAPATMGEERGG